MLLIIYYHLSFCFCFYFLPFLIPPIFWPNLPLFSKITDIKYLLLVFLHLLNFLKIDFQYKLQFKDISLFASQLPFTPLDTTFSSQFITRSNIIITTNITKELRNQTTIDTININLCDINHLCTNMFSSIFYCFHSFWEIEFSHITHSWIYHFLKILNRLNHIVLHCFCHPLYSFIQCFFF